MSTPQIIDSIAFELRFYGLIGAFEYQKYHISFLVSTFFVLTMGTMGIQHAITIVYIETVDQLTEVLYVVGIYVVGFAKLSGLVLNRDKVSFLLDSLNDIRILPPHWNQLYRNEFNRAVRHLRLSSRLFTFLCYFAVFATVAGNIFNERLLFPCYFPFETRHAYSLQGYWTAYSYQMIYACYLIQSSIGMDVVNIALMHCAAFKLKVMRHECKKLCSHSRCVDNLKTIKTAAGFHVETIRFVEDIEKIFNFGLFVQCFISGLSICAVMLKAIFLNMFTQTEQLLVAACVLTAFVSQLFYYCHYGNQINYESTKLFTSIYLCKWHTLKCPCYSIMIQRNHIQSIKRSVSIMLERTKRPTIVTAGLLIKLNYESFISICRGGYQAFAVFRDVLK